ncbi:MAG: ECF transporter S component [Lachnospiraceae bacterium]|uniref:ECF transporter S component n=1 Tax=Candidatus Weimeria bifida TaxID=2599074 RepID=A0A6N7IZT7_9FIRM|nr:ECF transporter S component [Candidatus Weimeria bifida]RRF96558.1 MAG: ECF transporter S component [Lachnospiraceae bacterium]
MNTKKKTLNLVLTALFTAIIVLMAFSPLGYIPLGVINATIIHIPVIIGAIFLGPGTGAFLGFVFGLTSFIKSTVTPSTVSAFVFSPVLAASQFGISGVFKSAFICFVPRILVGVFPYYIFVLIKKLSSGNGSKVKIAVLDAIISLIAFAGLSQLLGRQMKSGSVVLAVVISAAIFAALMIISVRNDSGVIGYAYAGLTGALTNTLLVMPSIYILYAEAYAKATNVAQNALLGVIIGIIGFNGVIEAVLAAVIVSAVSGALVHVTPTYAVRKASKNLRQPA